MGKLKQLENILLVDDDLLLNFIHKRLIEKLELGCEITICNSVKESMAHLKSTNTHDKGIMQGLIFLDLHMPDQNGWDFLEQYRTLPEVQKEHIKIVMLTTSLHPEDEARVRTYPEVVGFYNKPLTVKMLEEMISDHYGQA